MCALAAFVDSLAQLYPEAHVSMCRPALDADEAYCRVEELCDCYADITGCGDELRQAQAHGAYIRAFAVALKAEPDRVSALISKGMPAVGLVTSLAQGGAHAADVSGPGIGAADVVAHGHSLGDGAAAADLLGHTHSLGDGAGVAAEAGVHGLDLAEGASTLGLSVLASLGVGWYFRWRNAEKQSHIDSLVESVAMKARLVRALLLGHHEWIREAANRLHWTPNSERGWPGF